jgi:hypothetical protein
LELAREIGSEIDGVNTYLRRGQVADGLPLVVDLGKYWMQMRLMPVGVASEQGTESEAPGQREMGVLELKELEKLGLEEQELKEPNELEVLEELEGPEELGAGASLDQSSHPKKRCLVQAHWGCWAGSMSIRERCSIQR